jgi:hypothetical protein
MTIRTLTLHLPLPRHATGPLPAAPAGTDSNRSLRTASITAGTGLLLMSALAGFGYQIAVKGLVTQGNAAKTAMKIMAHQDLFRFGILSLFLVAALDVVVALALYRVFSPVSERISRLAAWLRIAYAGIFAVAISQLVSALHLLTSAQHLTAISTAHVHAQALQRINNFTDIWDAGLILFGLYLLLIAFLTYKSAYIPRPLGVLLAIAGLGYLVDSLGRALSPGSSLDVSTYTFIGEFLLALWLVIRGRNITLSQTGSNAQASNRPGIANAAQPSG